MHIGIARPGYHNERKFKPSMQTNYINYDILIDKLLESGHQITSISFGERYGGDRWFNPWKPLNDEYFIPDEFRTKTQQSVTWAVQDFLTDEMKLLDNLDALIMPFYSFFGNREIYFPLVYACATLGVKLIIWDTDANYIGEVGVRYNDYDIFEAANKTWCNHVYINDDHVDIHVIDNLDMTVLSPALEDINYTTYFPFFHIFEEWLPYEPNKKKFDVVYAGSSYRRRGLFHYYFDTLLYRVGLWGNYSTKDLSALEHSSVDIYRGHVRRHAVQSCLNSGKICVQIARDFYNKIGHVTPRVYETVMSGTVLLVDDSLKHGEKVVGEKYVVRSPEEVLKFVSSSDSYLMDCYEEQLNAPFIKESTPDKALERLLIVLEN